MQFHSRQAAVFPQPPTATDGDLRRRRCRRRRARSRRKDFHFRGGYRAALATSIVLIVHVRDGIYTLSEREFIAVALHSSRMIIHKRRKIDAVVRREIALIKNESEHKRYEIHILIYRENAPLRGSTHTRILARVNGETETSASSLTFLVSADSRRRTSSLFVPNASRVPRPPEGRVLSGGLSSDIRIVRYLVCTCVQECYDNPRCRSEQ